MPPTWPHSPPPCQLSSHSRPLLPASLPLLEEPWSFRAPSQAELSLRSRDPSNHGQADGWCLGEKEVSPPLRMGRGWASPEGACSSQQCSPAPPPFPSLSSPLPCLEHASSPPPCPLLATWKNTPGWNSVLEPPACKTWWGEEGSQLRAQPGKQPTGWEACRAARSLHKARQW